MVHLELYLDGTLYPKSLVMFGTMKDSYVLLLDGLDLHYIFSTKTQP